MNTAFEGCGEKTDLDLLFEEDKIALKTIAATFKSAMRLKYINGTQTEAMPFRYIRSRYEGRHLLPKTLSSVYVLPTLEDDLKLIVVQFGSLQSSSHRPSQEVRSKRPGRRPWQ